MGLLIGQGKKMWLSIEAICKEFQKKKEKEEIHSNSRNGKELSTEEQIMFWRSFVDFPTLSKQAEDGQNKTFPALDPLPLGKCRHALLDE